MKRFRRLFLSFFLFALFHSFWISSPAEAVDILLKDGRHLLGREGMIPNFGNPPQYASEESQMRPMTVVFLDDDLRRTYVPRRQVADVFTDSELELVPESFKIPQRLHENRSMISKMGLILKTEPFDEHGRRTIQMLTRSGPRDVIQCITEITPNWTRIDSVNFEWNMRIATSNIPLNQLIPILRRHAKRLCKGSEVESAQKIARFFIQAERYELAAYELNRVVQLAEGKDAESVRKILSPTLAHVRQLSAKRALNELKFRHSKGQYLLVQDMLEQFPVKGVAGETLVQVQELKEEYQKQDARIEKLIENVQTNWKKLEDPALREALQPVLIEILESVNYSTLARMEAFEELADVQGTDPQELLALAVTSWLMGSKNATDRIVIAASSVRVRQLIQDFMEAEHDAARAQVLRKFRQEEAGTVKFVSAILEHMKPPVRTRKEEWLKKDGFFKLETPSSVDAAPIRYWVQLPLEYDPLKLYPAVICLNGSMDSPEKELDWWTGNFNAKGFRQGAAGRNGYVVISVDWLQADQHKYAYSAREHAAVLNVLHHVTQRFSIDTDRIFLSGHFEGGEAAWDIGNAHPDLWAGIIPIACRAEKYCKFYWPNMKKLPIYFVCGELDSLDVLYQNAQVLTSYGKRGYDLTVVEYLGRGHEGFTDEIHRIFDWMDRKKRNFYPDEFEVRTMRPWDNFFWWVNVGELPANKIIWPAHFEVPPNFLAAGIYAELLPKVNTLKVKVPSKSVTLWIGPKMLDFDQKINLSVNGDRVRIPDSVQPNLETLLEDVRTRGDRQNPFWVKIEVEKGRVK